jgi:hypothetical protein
MRKLYDIASVKPDSIAIATTARSSQPSLLAAAALIPKQLLDLQPLNQI